MFEKPLRSSRWQWISLTSLLLPILFITFMGLLTIMSAGANKSDPTLLLRKQSVWLCLAVMVFIISSVIDLKLLKRLAIPLSLISFILLVLARIPGIGKDVKGSWRWIEVGPITFQPSDIGKFALVIMLATYLQSEQRRIKTFLYGFAIPYGIVGIFCILIVIEPDYGTTFLCFVIGSAMIFLAGSKIKYIILSSVIGLGGLVVGVILTPNRFYRLVSYLNLSENKLGGGYQLNQSLLAFGSGGVGGVGLGQGRQMSYLPESHTDFIFSIVGEEMGLVATYLVVLSFLIFFLVVVFRLRRAPNLYEFSLAIGSMLMVVVQALFNMGVVTGLLPTKGISLPFMSYGGSNLVSMFFFVGILVNCIRNWEKPKKISVMSYE